MNALNVLPYYAAGTRLALVEAALGTDLEREVLALMDFTPIMEEVGVMPGHVFG